jgi:hypothetical protein
VVIAMETSKTLEALERINRNLEGMGEKLEKIIELQKVLVERSEKRDEIEEEGKDHKAFPLDIDTMLSLPDHLRKTAFAISTLGSASATEVASETGRTRAAESDYLNNLVRMGYLKKERKGRTACFSTKK